MAEFKNVVGSFEPADRDRRVFFNQHDLGQDTTLDSSLAESF